MENIKIKQKIEEVPIDKITPHEGSHKTESSINLLVESIKDFGVNQPITVDKNYVVVTGNGVFKAAKIAGLKTIPCIVLDHLTDEEIKQYRIADDKTSEFATWNEKKLRQELSYLQDPSSVQAYFDEDILGMLGMRQKPKVEVEKGNKEAMRPQLTEEEKDNRFRDQIRQVDLDMIVKPAEYIEYTCSKCGRLVKVKSN